MRQLLVWDTGLILSLRPANGRLRYKVTLSLIGWAQTIDNVSQTLNKPGDILDTTTVGIIRAHPLPNYVPSACYCVVWSKVHQEFILAQISMSNNGS